MTDDGNTVVLTEADFEWLMERPMERMKAFIPDGQPREWFVETESIASASAAL